MLENIFRTKSGNYQLDLASGLFTRESGVSTPKRFIGSLSPHIKFNVGGNICTLDDMIPAYRFVYVVSKLLYGDSVGFTPEFRVESKLADTTGATPVACSPFGLGQLA